MVLYSPQRYGKTHSVSLGFLGWSFPLSSSILNPDSSRMNKKWVTPNFKFRPLFYLKENLSEISIVCDILARLTRDHLTEGTRDDDMTWLNPVSLLHNTIDQPQGGFPLVAHGFLPFALVECLPVIMVNDVNFVEIHPLVRPGCASNKFGCNTVRCNYMNSFQEKGTVLFLIRVCL